MAPDDGSIRAVHADARNARLVSTAACSLSDADDRVDRRYRGRQRRREDQPVFAHRRSASRRLSPARLDQSPRSRSSTTCSVARRAVRRIASLWPPTRRRRREPGGARGRSFMQRTGSAQVSIALIKRIPAGAGLGGGSSDAAAVLRALNALLGVPVARADLMAWALELGADVPLFVFGRPARMRGVGEILEPWPAAPSGPLVVAFAGAALETRAVYAKYDDLLTMADPPSTIRALTPGREPLPSMLHNDLEAAAFHVQPALRSLKKRLCALGAEGVLMTGSGSAVFGVWKQWDDARAAAERLRAAGVWARVVRVLGAGSGSRAGAE